MHRVGSIPFDIDGNLIALLFVTSQTRGRWILPKGLAKEGESHVETCLRESEEEAGVKGIVLEHFPLTVPISKLTDDGKQAVPVTYYPMLVDSQEDDWKEKEKRERHWALLSETPKVVHREDLLGLIRQFQKLETWILEEAISLRAK